MLELKADKPYCYYAGQQLYAPSGYAGSGSYFRAAINKNIRLIGLPRLR
jgi:hypothetical protein